MFRHILLMTVLFSVVLIYAMDEGRKVASVMVMPDIGEKSTNVDSFMIDFRFNGEGTYLKSDYPQVDFLPLETGENIRFDTIQWVTFKGVRVTWKKYIVAQDRKNYNDIESDGYRYWSEIEVDCVVMDNLGNLIHSRLKRPEMSDVFLVGQTVRGNFLLQIDQENGKTTRVDFNKPVLQCSSHSEHVFHNSEWKFCPFCGSTLNLVNIK